MQRTSAAAVRRLLFSPTATKSLATIHSRLLSSPNSSNLGSRFGSKYKVAIMPHSVAGQDDYERKVTGIDDDDVFPPEASKDEEEDEMDERSTMPFTKPSQLPIAAVAGESFSLIRKLDLWYVDKTRYIADLMNPEAGRKFSVLRPPHFGKTLTISTLASVFRGERPYFNNLYLG